MVKPSYPKLLSYHAIVYILPFILVGLMFFQKIYYAVHNVITLFTSINFEESLHVLFIVLVIAKALLRFFLTIAFVALIGQIFSFALHFIPYLAINHRLSSWKLIGLGLRKYSYIFLFNILGFIIISFINMIILIIPMINLLSVVTIPFSVAMFTLYKDYLFSTNMNNKKFILADPWKHLRLFCKNNHMLLQSGLLAASYYAFYIASVFIRPYAQLKLIDFMERSRLTDGGSHHSPGN